MYKYKNSRILLFMFAIVLLAGCKKEKSEQNTAKAKQNIAIDKSLPNRIDSCLKRQHPLEKTTVCVFDLTADKPVYGYHQDTLLPPASCMKLITGVAAIHLFGADYKFKTQMFARGVIRGGALNGDMSLKAGLDPLFTPADMQMFAKKLKAKGICKITGKIWVDMTMNQAIKPESHWYPWDLSLSMYSIFFKGSDHVIRNLKASLRANGISFADSNVVVGGTPKGSRCVYSYYRPLYLVVKKMWKNSSNVQSTSLLCAIGHRVSPHANPATSGIKYLYHFVNKEIEHSKSWGVIHDGCGLCPHNRLTSEVLVNVLKYGYHNPTIYKWMTAYLPLSGVDGSLHREMTHGPAYGKIRAKTGTLSHPYGISSLSGFCKGKNGHTLCFSILNSEMSVLDAHVTQRKLCEEFVQ